MKDPLLEHFASQEPILTPEERNRIIERYRHNRERMIQESTEFWLRQTKTNRPGYKKPINKPTRHPGVSEQVLERFKKWRNNEYCGCSQFDHVCGYPALDGV